MPRLQIDVSNTRNPNEAIPAGTYTMRVSGVPVLGESKETKKPMLKMTYTVVAPDEYAGKKFFDNLVLDNDFGKYRLRQFCELSGEDPTGPDTDEFDGVEFDAEVTVQESVEYGTQNRINRIFTDSAPAGDDDE